MVRTARQGPPADHSPRRASVHAFLRSAPGSRRSSSERVPPRARRTDRIARRLRTSASRSGRTALSLSWRRRASVLQRASPPGRFHRRRPPRPGDALRRPCRGRPPCVHAFVSCASPAPCGGGPRGSSPRRGPRLPCLSHSGRARLCAPFRDRIRTCCARAREDSCHTWGTGPSRGVRLRACGGVRALSCVPPRGPCTASVSPLSADCIGRRGRSSKHPNTGLRCPWCAGPCRR